jgi:hypothetical protein
LRRRRPRHCEHAATECDHHHQSRHVNRCLHRVIAAA